MTGDLDERKFRALKKYNNNRMGANESLLIFNERFRLLFDNCEMLGVDGFTDESIYYRPDAGR